MVMRMSRQALLSIPPEGRGNHHHCRRFRRHFRHQQQQQQQQPQQQQQCDEVDTWHRLFSQQWPIHPTARREILLSLCRGNELCKAVEFLFDKHAFALASIQVYLTILKACIIKKSLDLSLLIYAHLSVHSIALERLVGDYLVVALAKCGGIEDAYHTSRTLDACTVFSWTAMISSCVDYGKPRDALQLYELMQQDDVHANEYTFASLFKACRIMGDLSEGKKLHEEAQGEGFMSVDFLVNALVSMYGRCGAIADAEDVFCNSSRCSVVSWNSMMSVYVDQGKGEKALRFYRQMQEQGVNPDDLTIVSAIQACGILVGKGDDVAGLSKEACFEIGQGLHAHASRNGFMCNIFIGTTLVSMYGKCSRLFEAEAVFVTMPQHNSVSWNALQSAYVEQQEGKIALLLYRVMQEQQTIPDRFSLATALKACYILLEKEKVIDMKGTCLEISQGIYGDAKRLGFATDAFVCTALMTVYGKCSELLEVERVFGAMMHPSLVSWTAMLSAYVNAEKGATALLLYRQMLHEGLSPDQQMFVIAIQACINLEKTQEEVTSGKESTMMPLDIGRGLHVDALRIGFESDIFVGSSLVSLYNKLGDLKGAEHVFHRLSNRSVVCWTAMITTYLEWGLCEKALQLYKHMHEQGVSPDEQTILITLQACGALAEKELLRVERDLISLAIIRALHKDVTAKGHTADSFISSALVTMYGKCGAMEEAENFFRESSQHNVISWTAMVSTCVEQGLGEKALQVYRAMLGQSVNPDEVMLSTAISACCILKEDLFVDTASTKTLSLHIGQALHADARRMGLIEKSEIRNALVMLYGKCGAIREAEHVFGGIWNPDLDSWNSMLSSYVWSGLGEKALLFYTCMLKERIHPNNVSLVTVLQACNSLGKSPNLETVDGRFDDLVSLKIVRALRSDASSMGFTLDGIAGNTFVAMYGKSGTIIEAEDVFHGISNTGISSWNAMISAYVKQGKGEKAFKLYQRMQGQRVIPDEVTYICVLQAISEMGSLEACQELHVGITCCLHDLHQTIATTLIHAYGRCSSMLDAHAVHDALASPYLASYTACIDGYASQGNFADCMDLFATLQLANIRMDATVFTPLLAVCSRSGLVAEGLLLFECMMMAYNITADLMHYGSLVDLLGRAGDFNRITNIVSRMPQWEDQAIWSSLLGACRVHGNMELGEQAFSKAIHLEPKQVSAYVVMSNMVADCRQ